MNPPKDRKEERHPVNEGKVCPKGNFGYEFINREDRLTTPLIKVQADGGKRMAAADYLRGHPIPVNE